MSMKHRKLGRTSDQRRAMLRAMVTYLLENGQIKTTVTRAKEVAPVAEKMITLAKKNDLPAYRQALGYITKEDVAKKLFQEIGPKYAGTATGLISTIELLGPTLLPSYVLVPLCTGETGVDFVKFFFGIGIIFVILFVITALLPETGIKAAGKKS